MYTYSKTKSYKKRKKMTIFAATKKKKYIKKIEW